MKSCVTAALGLASAVVICGPSLAADDEILVQILARADIAHNFAFYCAQYDSSIIDSTRSTIGDMQDLMLHIRSEVVSGLPEPEAFQVVVRAANAARAEALLVVRRQYGPEPNEERARLSEWCEKSILPSLREFGVVVCIALVAARAYNVAASDAHTGTTHWLLEKIKQRSIAVRAGTNNVPSTFDASQIKDGFIEYNEMCITCHGAPGRERSEIGEGA